jgi:hypothetical protein
LGAAAKALFRLTRRNASHFGGHLVTLFLIPRKNKNIFALKRE